MESASYKSTVSASTATLPTPLHHLPKVSSRYFPPSLPPLATMSSISFSNDTPLASTNILDLANSGALDEISNSPSSVGHYIRNRGLVKEGKTNRALLFVIYQTGRYGPQNGFRLCLVQEGFAVDEPAAEEIIGKAESVVQQGAMEFIQLGSPRPAIADP